MENRMKKWKYIYTIFLKNQFCINKLYNVTVLLKSVHAVRQFIDKGSFSKMTSFSLENEYLDLVLFSSLELNSAKTGMTLPCSNKCIIRRTNWKHVTSHTILGNPSPFLMENNLKLSKIPRLHWTIPDASQELIPQLLYRIEIRAY